MANAYDITKVALDLVGAARGLPSGSIHIESMTLDELTSEAASLAKAKNVMEWALIGMSAALWFEHRGNERTLRQKTGMHSFPWGAYKFHSKMLGDIIEAGIPIDITMDPAIYAAVLVNGPLLTLSDRKVIFAAAMANKWPITNLKKAIQALNSIKKTNQDTFNAMLGEMAKASERRGKIDELLSNQETTEDSAGE